MSKLAGPLLQSPVKRISAAGILEKDNPAVGVTRLRSLLNRKVKGTKTEADSKTNNAKAKITKTGVWVDLQDGTKIKLCSACATNKKKVAADTQKAKAKSKVSKEDKENAGLITVKRTLKVTKSKPTASDRKILSDDEESTIQEEKTTTTTKVTKSKDAKKNKATTSKVDASIDNKEDETIDRPVKKQTATKTKRTPKQPTKMEINDIKEEKPAATGVTAKEKSTVSSTASKTVRAPKILKTPKTLKAPKILKTPKASKTPKIMVMPKTPKTPKTPKRVITSKSKPTKTRGQNNVKAEDIPINVTDEVKSELSAKKPGRKLIKNDDGDQNKSKTNEKASKTKSKATTANDKSSNKMKNAKTKGADLKASMPTRSTKTKKDDKENVKPSNVCKYEVNVKSKDGTRNESVSNTSISTKKRASIVSKKVKPVPVPAKEKRKATRNALKSSKIKQNTSNEFEDSLDNLKIHSTLIENNNNINFNKRSNNVKAQSNNESLVASRASVNIKSEPIDDAYEMNECRAPVVKHHVSFKTDSLDDLTEAKKESKVPESLNITFRSKSAKDRPAKSKERKSNQSDKDKRRNIKKDNKVAKALGQMSKHFANFHAGNAERIESGSWFGNAHGNLNSSDDDDDEEDDESSSCSYSSCSCYSSSSSTACRCWKCLMEESLNSSSWTVSSEYSDDTISSSSCGSDSSGFKDSMRQMRIDKTLSKSYDLRNRNT